MFYGLNSRSIKSFGLDRADVYMNWHLGQLTPGEMGKIRSIFAMSCAPKRRSINTLSFDRTDRYIRWHSKDLSPGDLVEIRSTTAMCYDLKLSPAAGMTESPLHLYNGWHSATEFCGEKGKFRSIFVMSHSSGAFSGNKRSREAGKSAHQMAFKAAFSLTRLTDFDQFRHFMRLQRLLQQDV